MKEKLLPLAAVITPSIPESMILTGRTIVSPADMKLAAQEMAEQFNCAVLCKGGYSINDANGLLYADGKCVWFSGKRIYNLNTHGIGCTLSSAIAANLAKGFSLEQSIDRAKAYISGVLSSMLNLGHGSGPLDHIFNLSGEYAKEAEKPVKATLVSVIVYGVVSIWMYLIGMGAAIYTGNSDIAEIMFKAGLGIIALLIIILSTVTATFLDTYSAGVSSEVLSGKIKGKWVAVGAAIIGTIGAIAFQITDITDFLYLIGSVFAPMIAVQIADFYILKKDSSNVSFSFINLIIWAFGFIVYRLLMNVDIMLATHCLTCLLQ